MSLSLYICPHKVQYVAYHTICCFTIGRIIKGQNYTWLQNYTYKKLGLHITNKWLQLILKIIDYWYQQWACKQTRLWSAVLLLRAPEADAIVPGEYNPVWYLPLIMLNWVGPRLPRNVTVLNNQHYQRRVRVRSIQWYPQQHTINENHSDRRDHAEIPDRKYATMSARYNSALCTATSWTYHCPNRIMTSIRLT